MTNTIVTIECTKLDFPLDECDEQSDSITIDNWCYKLTPLPGSLFESEMRELDTSEMLEGHWYDDLAFHKAMQDLIATKQAAFSESDYYYVIHTLWNERSWKEDDNWTGPGEWCSEYDYLGVLDMTKLAIVGHPQ